MWRTRLCAIILLAGLGYPQLCLSGQKTDSGEMATIWVLITDTFGALLPGAQIEIRRLHEGKELLVEFSGSTARDVPFGTYRISALVSGYAADSRTIEVDQPLKWITLALALGEIEGPSKRDIHGRIEPLAETARPIWVKLIGIYSHTVKEAPVNEEGRFLIEGVLPGQYLAIALAPGRVLKVQPFVHKFRDDAELVIKLSE